MRTPAIDLGLFFVLCTSACGDGRAKPPPAETGDCIDADGDGFGEGDACEGPDCNDADAALHTDAECDAWCDAHETAHGCPCQSREPEYCYDADETTIGVGKCHAGLATCASEGGEAVWGDCEGEIVPEPEACNGEDDDCDGEVDEGTRTECGTCGECRRDCTGPAVGCAPWGEGAAPGSVETEGRLELPMTDHERHLLWPYSTRTGIVLRVDTETFEVAGSFHSGPNGIGGEVFGDAPSAAAVDAEGNVVVANRNPFLGLPSITKIAADADACEDRDGDGTVETSTSWDDSLAFTTDESWDDECILFHTTFGAGTSPGSVVIQETVGLDGAAEEWAWVGLGGQQSFVQVDDATGERTDVEALTPGHSSDGAVLDADGWIWSRSLIGGLFYGTDVGRFDTADPDGSWETLLFPSVAPLSIALDENDVVWVGGTAEIYWWDDAAAAFSPVPLVIVPLGLAADGAGSIWAAGTDTRVLRVQLDDLSTSQVATPDTSVYGLAAADGHVWALGGDAGGATVVDVADESIETALDDCGGGPCLANMQINGDIAGTRHWTDRTPQATWTKVAQGCDIGTPTWRELAVDAAVPEGTAVTASIRTADSVEALAAATEVDLGAIPDGGAVLDVEASLAIAAVAHGAYAQVAVRLESLDEASTPTLERVELVWGCPDVFQ
jgi:hypothetical protein